MTAFVSSDTSKLETTSHVIRLYTRELCLLRASSKASAAVNSVAAADRSYTAFSTPAYARIVPIELGNSASAAL